MRARHFTFSRLSTLGLHGLRGGTCILIIILVSVSALTVSQYWKPSWKLRLLLHFIETKYV